MSSNMPLSDDELHAYADNQLSRERASEVAATLAHESALAARVAEIRRHNALLREALDPWLGEPLPRALLAAAAGSTARARLRWLPTALAVAASLVLGVGIGWFGRSEMLELAGTPGTVQGQAAPAPALDAGDAHPAV